MIKTYTIKPGEKPTQEQLKEVEEASIFVCKWGLYG